MKSKRRNYEQMLMELEALPESYRIDIWEIIALLIAHAKQKLAAPTSQSSAGEHPYSQSQPPDPPH